MNSANRRRAMLVSVSIILLCLTVLIGMTWALFTDTQTIKNRLQAGELKITLTRVGLTKSVLDDRGYLDVDKVFQDENDPAVDFTNTTVFSYDKNVFDISEDDVVVPGSKFTATMKLDNLSDFAFGYWIEVVCTDKQTGEAFAKQVNIIVNNDDDTVANGLKVGSKDDFIGVIEKGKSQTFTVTVDFVDEGIDFTDGVLSSKNDSAQDQNFDFDLIVYAVQATTAPTNP